MLKLAYMSNSQSLWTVTANDLPAAVKESGLDGHQNPVQLVLSSPQKICNIAVCLQCVSLHQWYLPVGTLKLDLQPILGQGSNTDG